MIRSGAKASSRRRQITRVRALDDGHSRIVAQAPIELAVGHVERDHARGAALKQAVGEATGGGTDVEAGVAADVEVEAVEGVGELDPATRDVGLRLGQKQLGVLGDELARLRCDRPVLSDSHAARPHGSCGARSRADESTLGEQDIETLLGHARNLEEAPRTWRGASGYREERYAFFVYGRKA